MPRIRAISRALPHLIAWSGALAVGFACWGAPWPCACAAVAASAGSVGWELHRIRARRRAEASSAVHDAQQRESSAALTSFAADLERRTAELEAAERHFQLALQGSNDGVWEHDLRTGELFLSPGFRERLGLEPGEFHGELAWFEQHLHPEDVERWRHAVQAHLEHRASYNLDLRLRVPSGEYRWFRARGSAEWDLKGRPVRMSGSLTDTTERRFAEARVRESEETFRTLSASSPVGILKADAGGQCDYCNARWQAITGVSDLEAMGSGWLDAVHECDRGRVRAAWAAFVSGDGAFDDQFRVGGPEGEIRWVQTRANPVHDERGRVGGFVATFEDVTEARRAAEALAEARDRAMEAAQAKSEFLANMSHEIRTPLNGVIGMAELLAGTHLNEEQRDYVRTINTSADALLAIINDILDFSKIEAGKMNIEHVDFDLRTVYEDVAELLAPRARERGLELVLAVEPSLPRRLMGDPTRIRQILINLVSNAIKFTEKGEIVLGAERIDAARPGTPIKLGVRDTGIGIPADRLGAVFESFTQADGSTTRKYGGTGLGLTICRQLARLMGGTIHVRSEIGSGSEFWVELPLEQATGVTAPAVSCDLADARVLVVDDHPINRRILVGTLAAWGAVSEAVSSGEAAIERVADPAQKPIDLVLMDFRMPGMDGLETASRLHALAGAAARPVVVLSSSGVPEELATGEGMPVALWLTRPVREAVLARALGRILGRAGAHAPTAAREVPEDFATLSLLLVEDNEVNRKVATRMLQKVGATAELAVNGVEAVRRIEQESFDLVFMDCQMPEMDGFEATRLVREREAVRGGRVRIVAMTANAMEGDRERCLACGMDDYVSKPVKLEPLLAQLRIALTLRLDGAA